MPDALELNVTTTTDATTIAETIFGDGIQVVSATLTGAATQAGTYSGGDATSGGVVPSDSGVILSTGNATDFTTAGTGTNTNTSAGTSTGHGGAGDADLDAISSTSTFDAVVFESTFIPDDDYITMQFVFSSEEYLEYVNSGVNDTLGVWVNGSFVPLTSSGDTVSIDTVNDSSNSNLYVDNPASADTYNTEMDGFTITLSFKAPVNPGEENTIRIGLADGGDNAYDTNVLIAADSIQTVALAFEDSVTMEANTTAVIDVLANDHDASGNGLTVTEINGQAVIPGQSVTLNTGETVTLNSDYTLSVAADSDLGETVFTYTVENGDGATDVGYVNIQTVADAPLDGIVEGSGAADVIDATFTGDPEGDMIDANDAIGVNGTTGDDDYVMAFGGDDTVQSGAGDDIVEAGSGDDVVAGGAGSDTLSGDDGNDTIHGGNDPSLGGGATRSLNINNQSFEQTAHSDGQYSQGIPGWTVSVSGSGQAGDYNPTSSEINTGTVDGTDVAWIYHGGGSNSVAISQTLSETYTAGDTYSFSADVGDGAYSGSGDVPYQINIYAGTTLIGSTSGSTGNINALTNVTVDSTVVDPSLNGQTISIEIVQPPSASGGELLIDNVVGTVTPAALPEDASGDLIDGGEGDDVIFGQGGDDTIALTDGFGNDTITGGETDETDGDTLDMSAVTSGVELDLSAADPEAGTVFETGSTGGATQFTEIENIILSAGRDIVHLADGGGQDAVGGFDISDSGDGTAVDQLDVSKLTSDGGSTPVTTTDVTVSSDPYGNAVLSFPGGESITLEGVNPLNLSTVDDLVAIGIPDGRDYIVEGTSGADTIDAGYIGDPEGDMVDAGDAADGSNDDVIEAGAGDDSVLAGAGDDSVLADTGHDTVEGGTGADTIRGGTGEDSIDGGDGADDLYGDEDDDTILGGAGDDTIDGGLGADRIEGGDDNDSISGNDGDDTILGGAGDDWLRGSVGNDEMWGGTGDDYIWSGFNDDTIRIENDFGNDTIEAEGINEVTGDVLDLSLVTDDLTIDLTGSNPEAGTFSDGTSTAQFNEIENIILGGGRDTITLADFSGADSVQAFDMTDSGDGSTNDQLDVSGLTSDWGTTPIHAGDVTVSDDGNGNALLSFPGGESITLVGVDPSQLATEADLVSIGIPPAPDFIVEGSSGDDTIDAGYTGDPEGDMVDANDHSDGSNDDSIEAGDGNDSVVAGDGADTVWGGNDAGADTILGGAGNDLINGQGGNDSIDGGADDDSIAAGAGDDFVTGGSGNDSINGGTGTDTLDGGSGDDLLNGAGGGDSILGGDDADTIMLFDGYGADTIAGGEGGVDVDVLDASWIGADLTLDLSANGAADNESGTLTSTTAGDVADFTEIESVVLGSGDDSVTGSSGDDSVAMGAGADTVAGGQGDDYIALGANDGAQDVVFLSDGDGSDIVQQFEAPIDNGNGTYTGQDQLDVSGLTSDGGTTPVTTNDVTVGNDGLGNAVLSFPGGESITLVGVAPSEVDGVAELVAIGIPDGRDFIVEGTSGNDTIDVGYTGDPEGDMIDALDHSDGSNDDSVLADAGDDSVVAGFGDDTVFGQDGADTILGGSGNDSLDGDDVFATGGADSIDGGAGNDTLIGDSFDDTLIGGAGDDSIFAGTDDDLVYAGTGDDQVFGEGGDDTVIVEDGFGNDNLIAGETSETDGDTLDLSNLTVDTTIDLTNANPEDVTISDGTDTINAEEFETLILGGGEDTLQLGDGGGSDLVAGFDMGDRGDGHTYDQLDVTGLTTDGTTPVTAWDVVVTDTNGDGSGDAILTFPGGESITLEGVAPNQVDTIPELFAIGIPCFTPGAMIITADGERPVEDIRPGDMVLTADNGFQPVRWVGSRTLGAAELTEQPELKPIVIRKGAFGNDRKMLVSPQHGFVMKTDSGERLIRAKHAAELYGGQIARIDRNCEQVTYVHIMFDRHEIVFAEGARTEAFYPGPQALKSIDREAMAELLTLFPELAHVAFGEDGAASRFGPPARDYLLGRDIRAMKKGAVGAHPTSAA
ncbi:choice-of-anchor L domain-containing protein [Nioella ostreopsis]|uniref:choice-of-anchor L domain-containing protein n=1 Tax=Nioella ostreopsis TaxID=2448479 RepID=UPI000FDBE8E1|nr:choice-of-anchor L domain-containing protein [Nioella ostreopsis]